MVTISISPVAAQSLYIRNARNVPFIPLRNAPFRATTKLSTLAHSSGSISFSPLRFLIKDKEIKKKKKSRGSSAVCYAAPLSRLSLQWISAISSAVLFFTKGTVIRKQFLVPLIAIQAPTSIISWMKGEYGIWAAFLGLLVRLFFFIPGELELPFLALLLVIVAPLHVMNLRGTQQGAIISLVIAAYLAYQHFSGAGSLQRAFDHPIRIRFIKEVFSPLELGNKKAAKDLESCWGVSNDKRKKFELIAPLSGSDSDWNSKVQIFSVKNRIGVNNRSNHVRSEVRMKGLSIKVPMDVFIGMFSSENELNDKKVEAVRKGLKGKYIDTVEGTCMNRLLFAANWSVLVNRFVEAIPSSFKSGNKRIQKMDKNKECLSSCTRDVESKALFEFKPGESRARVITRNEGLEHNHDRENVLFECFIGFAFDQLTQNLQKLDYLKAVASIWDGRKVDVNGFLGNLKFAKVGGVPSGLVGVGTGGREETGGNSSQKLAGLIRNIPLSDVKHLRLTLSMISPTDLTELSLLLGQSLLDLPDKKKLFSVQEFFRYTKSEGRRFFEELDRDGDGQVTLEDLEVAMKKRKLPVKYSQEFMRQTRRNPFSKSFGWKQFLSLMERKEPTILEAYTSLCLSESGTLQKSEILASLKNVGLPATEDNAVAMMRFLNAGTEESVSYGYFRNFMLLLPPDRLRQDDPRNIWFKAASVVAVAPPAEVPAISVLKSAIAGGLSCGLSSALMYPIDTVKTQLQASTTLTFLELMSNIPQVGLRGLYKGSIPAILGQFSSNGLRTGISEVSKLVLINVAPNLPDIQVKSMASFLGTVLGTMARLPSEVLKQRLQADLYDNVGEALIGTWKQDGPQAFFRGAGATLCRELPFYVAGMGLYTESKKFTQRLIRRELEPWEAVVVGAISGGLVSVISTPFDVIKTRMMTASGGQNVSMSAVAISILRHEGPLALFKGLIPRFFWIAPFGAMNFAGYELLRKAMDGNKDIATDQVSGNKDISMDQVSEKEIS